METTTEVRRRGPGRPSKTRIETPRVIIRTAANRFDLDMDRKPEHMSYQWFATTILGKPNREELITAQQNGWSPVPAGRHPELTGAEADDKGPVERGGQMLMERPQEITDEVLDMEARNAAEQMDTQLERVAAKSRAAQGNSSKGVTKISRKMVAISNEEE